MKSVMAAVIAAIFLLPFAGVVSAKEKAPDAQQRPSVTKERLITASATVVAVDQKKRIVTLKDPDGTITDIKVGNEVRNLPQVKPGDMVKLTYYQSIMIELMKPGKGQKGIQTQTSMERAKTGEKPHGKVGGQVTITAKITAINKKKQTVSLMGPGGKTIVAKAENPKNLELIKIGDEVIITYTEAVAISVENTKK